MVELPSKTLAMQISHCLYSLFRELFSSGSTSINWHEKCTSYIMKKLAILTLLSLAVSCTKNNLDKDLQTLISEDYYFGAPGSTLFYRTTSAETQEKYHYSECKKRILNGDQLRIESCVSSYWLKARSK